MRIPILTYHSMNIHGNEYACNDLAALASDLRTITAAGFRVRPLASIARDWVVRREALEGEAVVALTCDDGADFDFTDLDHPTWGLQRGVLNILRDFRREQPDAQPQLHVTAFAIASPEARRELDRTCMVGRGWWNDAWWPEAIASGLLGIANHSWDHNHDALPGVGPGAVARGTFATIDNAALADHEIRQADDYLRAHAPCEANALFAYPYGEANDFLAARYLPEYEPAFLAAFSTMPEYLTESSGRWLMPRFTCGRDWKSPAALRDILEGARP